MNEQQQQHHAEARAERAEQALREIGRLAGVAEPVLMSADGIAAIVEGVRQVARLRTALASDARLWYRRATTAVETAKAVYLAGVQVGRAPEHGAAYYEALRAATELLPELGRMDETPAPPQPRLVRPGGIWKTLEERLSQEQG